MKMTNKTDKLKYKLVYSKRRTLSVSIKSDASLVVRAPRGLSEYRIQSFLNEKKKWIQKKVEETKKSVGEAKKLKESIDRTKIPAYKKKAKKYLADRVKFYAEKFDLSYKNVRLSSAKTRWGSCSAQNNINLNWKVMFAPIKVIDYLVVHELAHTVEKNHRRAFWNLVEKMDPEYKIHRKWLKENNHLLEL